MQTFSRCKIQELNSTLKIFVNFILKEFQRKKLDLEMFNYWKATQFRFFFNYCGALVLYKTLPKKMYTLFTFSGSKQNTKWPWTVGWMCELSTRIVEEICRTSSIVLWSRFTNYELSKLNTLPMMLNTIIWFCQQCLLFHLTIFWQNQKANS